jgi:hypothetical protein
MNLLRRAIADDFNGADAEAIAEFLRKEGAADETSNVKD